MTNMKDFFNWVQAQQNNSMVKMNIDYQNRNQTPTEDTVKKTDDDVKDENGVREDTD
tara:strand:+ start:1612 stop:1782 length:171 start_codon:yes stop_codon:yes gene_type:complete